MKSFRFRLDTVLRLRDRQYQTEESKLWQLLGAEAGIRASLERLRLRHREEVARICGAAAIDAAELRDLAVFQGWARREERRLSQALAAARKDVDKQRQRTLEARRAYRLLERLKERRRKAWNIEFDRELEADAAEAFLSRWNRDAIQRRAEMLALEPGAQHAPVVEKETR